MRIVSLIFHLYYLFFFFFRTFQISKQKVSKIDFHFQKELEIVESDFLAGKTRTKNHSIDDLERDTLYIYAYVRFWG